jgi:hypothetical protein
MQEEIERFKAISDDGAEFTVIRHRSIIESRANSEPPTRSKGIPQLTLTDGRIVNQIDPETYQIVETNQIIRRTR